MLRKWGRKFRPRTGYEGPGRVYRYSSTLSLTSVLDGVGSPRHATPRSLYPRERNLTPTRQGAGWAPEPVWTGAEGLVPTGIRFPNRPARSESGNVVWWGLKLKLSSIPAECRLNVFPYFVNCIIKFLNSATYEIWYLISTILWVVEWQKSFISWR
jgi:hypothetical protein